MMWGPVTRGRIQYAIDGLKQRRRGHIAEAILMLEAMLKEPAISADLASARERAARAEEALLAMTESSDRLLIERDQYMNRLGVLLPTLTGKQVAMLHRFTLEALAADRPPQPETRAAGPIPERCSYRYSPPAGQCLYHVAPGNSRCKRHYHATD